MAQHSYSFRCLIWLCIIMILIQFSQTLNDDSSSIEDHDDHPLARRSSRKVAQMLQQILQRGEMQVQPQRIHDFLNRLHGRSSND